MSQQAFILRIYPSDVDRVPEALSENQIIIGWAKAEGLLDDKLSWEEFREIIRRIYYSSEDNLRRAGNAAGQMWRFIREMQIGDFVVVPYGPEFYVAEVIGPPTYDKTKVAEDTAYRRKVKWLNNGKSIPRNIAKSSLISRMKTQGTCAFATDLLEEINDCIISVTLEEKPTFHRDLQQRLTQQALEELRIGRIDSYGFENLVSEIMKGLGATETKIIPRSQDKGVDVIATFNIAGAFPITIGIQAKHWQPEPPLDVDVIEQLLKGIEGESADFGMIITTGSFSDSVTIKAQDIFEEKGIKIELVDGERFAKLIIEKGINITGSGA